MPMPPTFKRRCSQHSHAVREPFHKLGETRLILRNSQNDVLDGILEVFSFVGGNQLIAALCQKRGHHDHCGSLVAVKSRLDKSEIEYPRQTAEMKRSLMRVEGISEREPVVASDPTTSLARVHTCLLPHPSPH